MKRERGAPWPTTRQERPELRTRSASSPDGSLALLLQNLLKQVALLGRKRPLLYKPLEKLSTRAAEHAPEQVPEEPAGDILVRPNDPVTERLILVHLAEESLLGQPSHEVGDSRVRPVEPRDREVARASAAVASPCRQKACMTSSSRSVRSFAGGRPIPVIPQPIWYSEFGFPNLATPAISSMPASSASLDVPVRHVHMRVSQIGGEFRHLPLDIDSRPIPAEQGTDGNALAQVVQPRRPAVVAGLRRHNPGVGTMN